MSDQKKVKRMNVAKNPEYISALELQINFLINKEIPKKYIGTCYKDIHVNSGDKYPTIQALKTIADNTKPTQENMFDNTQKRTCLYPDVAAMNYRLYKHWITQHLNLDYVNI